MHARTRLARRQDAVAIARIYNQGIEDRLATFETRLRTAGDIEAWFDGVHPVVVVEASVPPRPSGAATGIDPGVAGSASPVLVAFAATSTYRPRDCYAHIAEFSVYVAREERAHGYGEAAMLALFSAAKGAGLRKLVSRVFVENVPSRNLLARVGFREVGVYLRHGQVDGVWHDVVIVERLLDDD